MFSVSDIKEAVVYISQVSARGDFWVAEDEIFNMCHIEVCE